MGWGERERDLSETDNGEEAGTRIGREDEATGVDSPDASTGDVSG